MTLHEMERNRAVAQALENSGDLTLRQLLEQAYDAGHSAARAEAADASHVADRFRVVLVG